VATGWPTKEDTSGPGNLHVAPGIRGGPGPAEGAKFRPHTMMTSERTSAILPLSLLEAMRNLDRPVEDGLEELSTEIIAKRLGLNATVSAQIDRYRGLARRKTAVEPAEVEAVFELVSRRPDARLVYADAGRRAARHAARSVARTWRLALFLIPRRWRWRRRLGSRKAAVVAGELLGVRLTVDRLSARAELAASPANEASCEFIGAAMSELLRALAGFEGAMVHQQCRARGEGVCLWRSEAVDINDPY